MNPPRTDGQPQPTAIPPQDLGRRARALGAVLWASFLAASAGTMFFFAFVSPDELLHRFPEDDHIDHIGVYTLGFFGLWLLGALAATLALYLRGLLDGNARRRGPGEPGNGDGDGAP
jgi:Na+-driven multidrug efflux pump